MSKILASTFKGIKITKNRFTILGQIQAGSGSSILKTGPVAILSGSAVLN